MLEKKKTRILIGYERHTDEFGEHEENLKKADVVLAEIGDWALYRQVLSKDLEELEREGARDMFGRKSHVLLLKKSQMHGKEVRGYDDLNVWEEQYPNNPEEVPEKIKKLPLEVRKFYKNAELEAKVRRIRDDYTLDLVRKNLEGWKGKTVYIIAGTAHTRLYHVLKKELEPKGIEVRWEFKTKGRYGVPRILETHKPASQLARAIEHNAKMALDPEKVKRLYEEQKRYDADLSEAIKNKLKEMNLTEENFKVRRDASREVLGRGINRRMLRRR
jgi:hypothetical protein